MGQITVGPRVSIPKIWAGRGAVKVTTPSARATAPTCSPITSASAPEGMSTATTGAQLAFSAAIASPYNPLTGGRKPVPRMASTRTSATKTARAGSALSCSWEDTVTGATGSLGNISAASRRSAEGSDNSSTRTCLPAWCSLRAATNPSPPLFPFPQITPMRLAEGYCVTTKSATAVPAFSMRVSEGTPKRSLVMRSISLISAAVTIFIAVVGRSSLVCRG